MYTPYVCLFSFPSEKHRGFAFIEFELAEVGVHCYYAVTIALGMLQQDTKSYRSYIHV